LSPGWQSTTSTICTALAASDDDLVSAACGHADEAVRKGAAGSRCADQGAANRETVIAALRNLLTDDSEAVREEAAGFVTQLRDEDLSPWGELL
jgi:HEAT repeat protein